MLKTTYPNLIVRTLFHSIFCGNLKRFILVFCLFTSISLFAAKPVRIIVSLPPLYTPFLHEYTSEGADQLQGSKIIYVAKGDYINATFSGISLVPIAGDAAGKGLKYTIKVIENSSSAGKNAVGILRKIPVDQLTKFIKKIYSLPTDLLQRLFKDFIENPVLLEKVALNQKLVDSWKVLDDVGETGLVNRIDDIEFVDAFIKAESKIPTQVKTLINDAGGFTAWKLAKAGVKNLDDLKLWAKNNGLESLTDVEIKGTFDLFEGNISFSQKALLSTKDIVSGKNLDELASHFNLPINPSAQSLTPYQARIWYSWRKSKISSLVDRSNGLESAAREALEMRNTIRTTTRTSMLDTDIASFLNTKEVNMTWAQAMSKYNGDYNEIINASMRGRGLVDVLFKIPK